MPHVAQYGQIADIFALQDFAGHDCAIVSRVCCNLAYGCLERTADNVSLNKQFPLGFPRMGYWTVGAAIVVLLTAQYLPRFDLFGKEAPMEEIFSNYKDIRGLLYPSKTEVLLRGHKHMEYEVVEYLPLERFDPSEFVKP